MRPVKLTISGFGPYAEKVDINYEDFGKSGLYLISGNTGSGKSTIFDAIKFALYGDDAYDGRTMEMFRSKYAGDSVATYVELVFRLNGKEYTVRRNPRYKRPKTRGEGYTEARADAVLNCDDGKVITGYGAVTTYIEELLGLNSDQFSRIVMIAQGRFRELLLADTASRSKIFRDIFKTYPYEEIQKKIKGKYLARYKEYCEINRSVKQYVSGIKCCEGDELFSQVENIKNADMITDGDYLLLTLKKLIEKSRCILEDCDKKNKGLTDEINAVGKNVELLIKLQSGIDNCNNLKIEYKTIEQKGENIIREYEELKEKQQDREKCLILTEELKKILDNIQICEEQKKSIEGLKKKQESLEQEKIRNIESVRLFGEKMENLDKRVKRTEEEKLLLVNKEREYEAITQEKSRIHKIWVIEESLEELKVKHGEAVEKYEEGKIQVQQAGEIYSGLLNDFLDAQAGIMAAKLKENPGLACPVCGNIHYMKLADTKKEPPSQKQVDDAKMEYDKKQTVLSQLSTEAGAALKAYTREREYLAECIKEINSKWNVENYKNSMQEYEKELKSKAENVGEIIKQKRAYIEENRNAREELEAGRKHIEQVRLKVEQIGDKCEELKLSVNKLETRLKTLSGDLEDEDRKEVYKRYSEESNRYKKMCDEYDNVCKLREEYLAEKSRYETFIQVQEKENKNVMDIISKSYDKGDLYSVELLAEILSEEMEKKDRLVNEHERNTCYVKEIFNMKQTNEEILNNLKVKLKNSDDAASDVAVLKVLSDTYNGEVEGKEKIKLETYVQISYFEEIIRKANIKLLEMTEGQYEFVRDRGNEDKRSKSGLELNVYDHYNSTERSVKTLSGGESFMASLSLALGMADIVEENAGGIAIDTMFIDEGFGTLDESSLDMAMKVLSSLAGGNKLIGIISHVGSLRERIDNQIHVEKTMSRGSMVKQI